MNNVIAFIQSMEQSEGLKSSDKAKDRDQINFEAANEIIEMLGGTLKVKPASSPDDPNSQNALNVIMYINALIVRHLYESSKP